MGIEGDVVSCLYEIVLLFSCSLSLILSLCFLFLSYFILLFSLFKIVWFQISSRWIGDHSRYGIHWPAIGNPSKVRYEIVSSRKLYPWQRFILSVEFWNRMPLLSFLLLFHIFFLFFYIFSFFNFMNFSLFLYSHEISYHILVLALESFSFSLSIDFKSVLSLALEFL